MKVSSVYNCFLIARWNSPWIIVLLRVSLSLMARFMLLVFICFYDVFNPILVAFVKNDYA